MFESTFDAIITLYKQLDKPQMLISQNIYNDKNNIDKILPYPNIIKNDNNNRNSNSTNNSYKQIAKKLDKIDLKKPKIISQSYRPPIQLKKSSSNKSTHSVGYIDTNKLTPYWNSQNNSLQNISQPTLTFNVNQSSQSNLEPLKQSASQSSLSSYSEGENNTSILTKRKNTGNLSSSPSSVHDAPPSSSVHDVSPPPNPPLYSPHYVINNPHNNNIGVMQTAFPFPYSNVNNKHQPPPLFAYTNLYQYTPHSPSISASYHSPLSTINGNEFSWMRQASFSADNNHQSQNNSNMNNNLYSFSRQVSPITESPRRRSEIEKFYRKTSKKKKSNYDVMFRQKRRSSDKGVQQFYKVTSAIPKQRYSWADRYVYDKKNNGSQSNNDSQKNINTSFSYPSQENEDKDKQKDKPSTNSTMDHDLRTPLSPLSPLTPIKSNKATDDDEINDDQYSNEKYLNSNRQRHKNKHKKSKLPHLNGFFIEQPPRMRSKSVNEPPETPPSSPNFKKSKPESKKSKSKFKNFREKFGKKNHNSLMRN